ncbi:MAG TPA: hypothetical protein VK465_13990, partial [Fibrobacteria bacterium]|nr:hypothetical protein [Fibrobacteria bacterium]
MSPATATSVPVSIQLDLGPITEATPMGGNILPGQGATFVIWAPAAREVSLLWAYAKSPGGAWEPGKKGSLAKLADGRWAGFVPGLVAGDRYMFHVVGPADGTEGLKRD